MTCEFLNGCPFYNEKMPIENGLGAIYKKKYCESGNKACARYRVCTLVGKPFVPQSLYPNMHDIADRIIMEKAAR